MIELAESKIYEFEYFRLEAKSHRLFRRDSDELVPLTPKAVELLIYLVENAGRILSKEKLLEAVWDNSFVEDSNLSQTIFVLRKTLGEDTKKPRFILTVPNRGYQFIAQIKEIADENEYSFDKNGTTNKEAYQAFVRGRFFWNKRTSESLKQAVKHFEQAIEQDPNFATAYQELANCHQLLAQYYEEAIKTDLFTKAKSKVNKAQKINHKMAEAHANLGYAQAFYNWDWANAEESFKLALEANPNYATAHQWYADYLGVMGRFDEALEHIHQAIALDPVSPIIATSLSAFYYTQRQGDQLIEQAQKVINLDPEFAYGWFYLGFGYEFKEMYKETVDAFVKTATLFGEPVDCAEEMREAFNQNGITGVWLKRLEQYETRPHLKDYPTYLKSLVPIRLGYKDTSLAMLNQAYQQRDRGIIYAKYEPFLEPLRADPRFQDLIRRIGL